MIKKAPFYKILSAVHIVFFSSVFCFGTIFLSFTMLMIPALGAVFQLGKEVLYGKIDITDSIVAKYFRYLKDAMGLMRFVPVNLIMVLNVAGMWVAVKMRIVWILFACLAIVALMLTVGLYIAGYFVFVGKEFSLVEAAVAMLIKPLSLMSIFAIMILFTYFFSGILVTILMFMGTFFLFVAELVIFITMLHYLKALGQLDLEDEFAHLITGKK